MKRKLMSQKNSVKAIMFIAILLFSLSFANAIVSDSEIISVNLVNQDPDPAIAGDIVEIRIGLENLGGDTVSNFRFELLPKYPFELVSGEDAITKVGAISAYQRGEDTQVVKYRLRVNRDAIAGEYDLDFTYYEEGSPLRPKDSIGIDIRNKESAEIIHIDKSVLVPGAEEGLKFTINNVGNAPLRDITFYWENEDKIILPVGSDNTKYIKYLEIGESVELQYNVIADSNADPGLYSLDLHLNYDDPLSNEDKEVSTIAGVYVGGETDFEVSFSESTSGETSFNIANIGSNPAYSVSVIVPKQAGWKTTGSNSEIIGNLDKGDYTVATFTIQSAVKSEELTEPKRPTSEKLQLEVAYTDTRGQRNTVEKEVVLSSSMLSTTMATGLKGSKMIQEESFFTKYKWYMLVVALIAGMYYYFKIFKQKKKR